jgi:hypothetical protein
MYYRSRMRGTTTRRAMWEGEILCLL